MGSGPGRPRPCSSLGHAVLCLQHAGPRICYSNDIAFCVQTERPPPQLRAPALTCSQTATPKQRHNIMVYGLPEHPAPQQVLWLLGLGGTPHSTCKHGSLHMTTCDVFSGCAFGCLFGRLGSYLLTILSHESTSQKGFAHGQPASARREGIPFATRNL